MLISTKGRYALRFMISLAEAESASCAEAPTDKTDKNEDGSRLVPLTELAEEQEISEKYLEAIVSSLTKRGLITGRRGKSGGYRLTRPADKYTAGEIIVAAEGSVTTVACLETADMNACRRSKNCKTLPLWERIDGVIKGILNAVTLEDMKNGNVDTVIDSFLYKASGKEGTHDKDIGGI